MKGDLLDYAKWYLYKEEYFISKRGSLIVRYPNYFQSVTPVYAKVYGFRFHYQVAYEDVVELWGRGKKIIDIPHNLRPINHWQAR